MGENTDAKAKFADTEDGEIFYCDFFDSLLDPCLGPFLGPLAWVLGPLGYDEDWIWATDTAQPKFGWLAAGLRLGLGFRPADG